MEECTCTAYKMLMSFLDAGDDEILAFIHKARQGMWDEFWSNADKALEEFLARSELK